MKGTKLASSFAVFLLLFAASGAFAQGNPVEFEPFTEVENVCPDCERPPADKVNLDDGTTIRCTIVAENSDFLVLEKYGEVRGVSKGSVKSTSFADSRPSDLGEQDQIVLGDGRVLTGQIVDESDKPGHFQLKSSVNDVSYVVFKSEVAALYRKGTRKEVETPEEDSGDEE